MELKLVSNLSKEDYDRYISRSSGSFLQSWDWGEWMEANGKTPARVAVAGSDGNILLTAQIFVTPIPKLDGNYLYIPYGPVAADAGAEIINFFLGKIKKQFPHALFLRIEPQQAFALTGKPTKHIQPGKTLVLDLVKSEDELLAEMHQKTRYNIKVAQRHEVEIKIGHSEAALKLIDETSGRQGYKNHPLSYYQKMVEFFGSQNQSLGLKVYSAQYNGQTLASAIMIDYGSTRTYLFGGTSDSDRNTMAPYLLHWQAIADAKKAGQKTYDFWGIETASGKTPGFVRFKLGWGGQQINYPATTDIIYKRLWYNAYKLLRSLNRKFS